MGCIRSSSLLFLFILIGISIEQDIRSVAVTVMNGIQFQCGNTTCLPINSVTTLDVSACAIAFLSQIQSQAATFHQSTSICELFNNIQNQNGNLISNTDTISLMVISNTRIPCEVTTTTTTTTTTITITTTTTTIRPLLTITQSGDFIIGLYNTTAGGPTGGYNGLYYSNPAVEGATKAIDGLLTTKYLNFGTNNDNNPSIPQPGAKSGFYVTPSISNASIACALRFATANDYPNRDPLTVTLEGTNSTALNASSSWILIYNGPTGIDPINNSTRSTYGTLQLFSNAIAFRSYRLLITSQRGSDNSVQYAESQIMGYY